MIWMNVVPIKISSDILAQIRASYQCDNYEISKSAIRSGVHNVSCRHLPQWKRVWCASIHPMIVSLGSFLAFLS